MFRGIISKHPYTSPFTSCEGVPSLVFARLHEGGEQEEGRAGGEEEERVEEAEGVEGEEEIAVSSEEEEEDKTETGVGVSEEQKILQHSAAIVRGSAIAPTPTSPQASCLLIGEISCT